MQFKYYGYKDVSGSSLEEVRFKNQNYIVINRRHVCSNDENFQQADKLTKKRILSKIRGKGYDKKNYEKQNDKYIDSYNNSIAGASCVVGSACIRWILK